MTHGLYSRHKNMALAINLWELMVDVWVGIGLQLSLQNAICTIFDRPFCELILILRANCELELAKWLKSQRLRAQIASSEMKLRAQPSLRTCASSARHDVRSRTRSEGEDEVVAFHNVVAFSSHPRKFLQENKEQGLSSERST